MNENTQPSYLPRFPGSGRLKDRVCLITGGSSGIGRATAIGFAREGAKAVVVTYHSDAEEAAETVRAVEAEGASGEARQLEAGDRDAVFALVADVVAQHGGLDVLVTNASHQKYEQDFCAITEDAIRGRFDTNVMGYFWAAQAALPHLREVRGSIVMTTSVNAYRGNAGLIDYSATKGAELALLRSLAANLAETGVRVNGVAPGPIWTPLIPQTMPKEAVESFGDETPMKRPGQPNEVASAFVFLASDEASYITGQVLHPNGGMPVNG